MSSSTRPAADHTPPAGRWARVAAIVSLSAGGFGLGLSEFVPMGLLPQMAADLVPAYAPTSPEAASRTGWTISVYAAGVVVGVPLTFLLAGFFAPKRFLVAITLWFCAMSALTAVLPTLTGVIVARFLAGLPHGVYFGIATIAAADVLGGRSRARAGAYVLLGLTLANLIGVPLTVMGVGVISWRAVFAGLAVLFAVVACAVAVLVPGNDSRAGTGSLREFAIFRSSDVWLMIAMGTFGFAGFFAVYSYIAPLATGFAHLPGASVPWLLMTAGLGMVAGLLAASRWGDRNTAATVTVAYGLMLAASVIAVPAIRAVPATIFLVVLTLSFGWSMINPAALSRIVALGPDGPRLAASVHHGVFNIANSLGAFTGGLVIVRAGFGATFVLAGVLVVAGAMLALLSFQRTARTAERPPAAASG